MAVTQEEHLEGLPIGTRGGVAVPYSFPQDGEYEIHVRLRRDRAGEESVWMVRRSRIEVRPAYCSRSRFRCSGHYWA